MVSPLAKNEVDALAALMREVIEPIPYYNEVARRAEHAKHTPEKLRALIAEDPHAILVSRDARGLTGFCVSGWDDATIWLYWFGVAPRARGQGIGASLLGALADTLPSRGAHKIWCDSRTENKESAAVLELVGFKRVATLANHWYNQDYFLWEWVP
jgi:ribosomal protein S18 acetylase RimI-like enzyme